MFAASDNWLGFSDAVWLAIVGLATLIIKELLDMLKSGRVAVKADIASAKVDVLATNLAINTTKTEEATKAITAVDAKVDKGISKTEENSKAIEDVKISALAASTFAAQVAGDARDASKEIHSLVNSNYEDIKKKLSIARDTIDTVAKSKEGDASGNH